MIDTVLLDFFVERTGLNYINITRHSSGRHWNVFRGYDGPMRKSTVFGTGATPGAALADFIDKVEREAAGERVVSEPEDSQEGGTPSPAEPSNTNPTDTFEDLLG